MCSLKGCWQDCLLTAPKTSTFCYFGSRGLPTDRPMWSDESGLKECTKGGTHPPSPQWSWVGGIDSEFLLHTHLISCFTTSWFSSTKLFVFQVSEWAVDYNVPGGTDKEGWQYAADFPAYVIIILSCLKTNCVKERCAICLTYLSPTGPFMATKPWRTLSGAEDGPGNQTHSHTFLWFVTLFSIKIIPYSAYRKCKITLRGPWQQVPPIPLSDISLMPCLAQSRMEQVPVWALSDKGDVLCRLGVSPQNPAVRNVLKNEFWQ